MENARYNQTAVTIDFTAAAGTPSGHPQKGQLRSSGSILQFDGWMKLFPHSEDSLLPPLSEQQDLTYADGLYAQKFTQPPARFNDASLIKELEKKGIGRPSTYASIISVIIDRGYVERAQKRFFATPVGMTVSDFLLEHFPEIMDYAFTAEMEGNLDAIAAGEKQWRVIVGEFFTPLHKKIELVTKDAGRTQIPVEKTGQPCPLCHDTDAGEIVIRSGKFGKFHSCSRYPECSYTKNIVEVVPDVICPLCQQGEVTIKNTRWGKPFFGCGRYPECNWASWKKPQVGETVTQADWAVMQAQREERKQKWLASRGKTADASGAGAAKKPAKKTTAVKKTATKKSVARKKTVKTTVKKTAVKKTTAKKST